MIRILIADDHQLVRDGLRAVIAEERDMVVCGIAEDGESAVELCRELVPDVVLMDLSMPRLDGLGALRAVLADNPHLHVVMVSADADPAQVRAALAAGAGGYVVKGTPPADLVEAVRAVRRGETALRPPGLIGSVG